MDSLVKVLVLAGEGLNCEKETASSFSHHGAMTDIHFVQELIEKPELIHQYHILAIPGGFSFADELGSARALAYQLRTKLGNHLTKFIEEKKLVIGICNGFQVLVRMGLLPGDTNQKVELRVNESGEFICDWIYLQNEKSICKWTQNLPEQIFLPIRHMEGRLSFQKNEAFYQKLKDNGQIPFTYSIDVNGSDFQIASLCDESGQVFGLMPHPEAATNTLQFPIGNLQSGVTPNDLIFKNGVDYVRSSFED